RSRTWIRSWCCTKAKCASRGPISRCSRSAASTSSCSSCSMPRKPAVPFEAACALLHDTLSGAARRDIVADLTAAASLRDAPGRLREGMRAHAFTAARQRISLERFVGAYDRVTREEGFHVLHDWDGKADRVGDDSIPVDVLSYVAQLRGGEPVRP